MLDLCTNRFLYGLFQFGTCEAFLFYEDLLHLTILHAYDVDTLLRSIELASAPVVVGCRKVAFVDNVFNTNRRIGKVDGDFRVFGFTSK